MWYRAPEVLLGAEKYSLPVDVYSVGCIFYELKHKRAFLTGDSEIDQIYKIFQLLGTPNEEIWPGVSEYEFMKPTFPKFKGIDLAVKCEKFNETELDLMAQLIALVPSQRISAIKALKHVSSLTQAILRRH